jgi:hypothetical protein
LESSSPPRLPFPFDEPDEDFRPSVKDNDGPATAGDGEAELFLPLRFESEFLIHPPSPASYTSTIRRLTGGTVSGDNAAIAELGADFDFALDLDPAPASDVDSDDV